MKRYVDDGNHELVGIYDAMSEDIRYMLLSIARRLIRSSKNAHLAPPVTDVFFGDEQH